MKSEEITKLIRTCDLIPGSEDFSHRMLEILEAINDRIDEQERKRSRSIEVLFERAEACAASAVKQHDPYGHIFHSASIILSDISKHLDNDV